MTIKNLQKKIVEYRDERDWKQYHGIKNLLISLQVEMGELFEHFLWKNEEEIEVFRKTKEFEGVKEEVCDVLHNILLIADNLNMDLESEFLTKMKKNAKKYPVEKARGKHKKYTEY